MCLISYIGYILKVNKGNINIANISVSAGVEYLIMKFIISLGIRFLLKSFNASLIGCKIPIKPTLFGPFRSWI